MSPEKLPNIMLILIDAARFDRFGFNGYHLPTTPNLDRLAKESVVFTQAYSAAPWTLPAVASIFTGLYPSEHGVHFGNRSLCTQFQTLAELMSKNGYQTLGTSSNPWVGPGSDISRGFQQFILVDRLFDEMPPKRWQAYMERAYRLIRRPQDSGGQRTTRTAIKWLKRMPRSQPFFLFLHYMEPHAPYRPTWLWAKEFFADRSSHRSALKLANVELAYLARKRGLGKSELDQISRLYEALLRYVDDQIGALVAILTEMDLLEETMIIVTSDHGENLGDHNLLGHQYCLYDSLLHVPLMIRYPGWQKSLQRQELVLNMDLFATILSYLNYDQHQFPYLSRWVDLNPTGKIETTQYIFAQYLRPMIERFQRYYPGVDYRSFEHELWSARSKQYKLIGRDDGQTELYNIENDPGETVDLSKSHPEVVAKMRAILDDGLSTTAPSVSEDELDLDEITLDRLRALGYVE
jgi:arylsulfatase A-like enzyme